jgi:3'-phosphoadenosine 5'-phosphosulfate sulfotransferase (PAPS reductase)/FAD synthetase
MSTPDTAALLRNDLWLVNSSAGKDSQAMLDFLVGVADSIGFPRERIIVVHCDLGRVEWEGTLELAREQAEHYGLRFEVVRRDLGDLITQVEQRHEANVAKGRDIAPWPSSAARWCTSDQKTSQVQKLMTRLVQEAHLGRPLRILNCLGIRAQESVARSKKEAYGPDMRASTKTTLDVTRWLPIFDWSEDQVWERIRESGVRHHRAYDLGMSRLSCAFCVMASKQDLIIAARANPDLAQEYARVEVKVGKRFTNKLSMAEVIQEAQAVTQGVAA